MSVLLAIAGQWKMGLMGLLAAGLLIGGWTANGWRLQAAQATVIKAELRREISNRVQSDAARLAMARELADAEAQGTETTKTIIQKVKVLVHDRPECDIPSSVTEILNNARGDENKATSTGK